MLSNKLTFSLVFVLALVLIAGPALAQTQIISDQLNTDGAAGPLGDRSFVVFEMNGALPVNNGIIASVNQVTSAAAGNFPDIDELLKFGGTIELLVSGVDGVKARELVITEIMWGLNQIGTPATPVAGNAFSPISQWIEVYNERKTALASGNQLRLLFTANERKPNSRVGKTVILGSTADPPAAPDAGLVQELPAVPENNSDVITFTVVDSVWIPSPKGNGGRSVVGPEGQPIEPLVSMYRKRSLSNDGAMFRYNSDNNPDGDKFANGQDAGQWLKSNVNARINISGRGFIGTPGKVHIERAGGGARDLSAAEVDAVAAGGTGIIINEVRDDPSIETNLDWVELYNNSDTTAVNVDNWRLSLITDGTTQKEVVNIDLTQEYRIPPRGFLLLVNQDPASSALAGGVDIAARDIEEQINRGAKHAYYIDERLDLPGSGKYLLVLRTDGAMNGTDNFVDYAGGGTYPNADRDTSVFPIQGIGAPGDHKQGDINHRDMGGDNTFAHRNRSFGRIMQLNNMGEYVPKSRGNRFHHEDWQDNGFASMGGVGYDRGVNLANAPGTPGYPNVISNFSYNDRGNAGATDDYDFSGTVTISEVMYDAGPRWNLVQWIELYNSSSTEAIDISGWELEIRNHEQGDPDGPPPIVDSFVDSIVEFDAGTIILPNQTLLIVSGSGANNVARERVYDLFQRHRRELGFLNRGNVLLSNYGFYLQLRARSRTNEDGRDDLQPTEAEVMDTVSNLELEGEGTTNIRLAGPRRVLAWSLSDIKPKSVADENTRKSIVRKYGGIFKQPGFELGTGPYSDLPGTTVDAFRRSDLIGAGLSFYGHLDDVGTPGFRLGGPLPVELSSFRPVRDAATGDVVIRWATESELNNAGFNILRSETKNGEFTVVNLKGIIPGHGTTSEKHVYEWTDTTAKPNVVYYYQIEDVSLDGNRTTLATTHLRGNVNAAGKLTTTWGNLKTQQ